MGLAESGNEDGGRHLVLVHGAGHGAWCWFKLSHLLTNAGHRVTAIDLTASGTNPTDAEEVRSWSHNNEPLLHLFESLLPDHKVILVGHSMGGMNMTCIMEQFPHKIDAAVFVAAFMPLSGTSVIHLLNEVEARIGTWGDTEFNYGRGRHNPPTSFKLGKQFLREYLYQRSPSQVIVFLSFVVNAGISVNSVADIDSGGGKERVSELMMEVQDIVLAETLVRKHPLCEGEVVYTREGYGRVKRVYVVAKEDKTIWEDLQRKMIHDNPPDRVYEIEESDHSPFFCNPSGLANILLDVCEVVRCT